MARGGRRCPGTGLGFWDARGLLQVVQGLLRRISWGEPQLLALRLGPGERGRPFGWKSGVTRHGASPSLPLPVHPGALLGGVTDKRPRALATGPCLVGAAFGGYRSVRRRAGGHGPQSHRFPGSPQAAAPVAGQAAAPPFSARTAEISDVRAQEGSSPAEGALLPESGASTARSLGQWLLCRVPEPGARRAPTPAGGAPRPLGHLVGSHHAPPPAPACPRCLRVNVPFTF